jgi:hypothetical protein
MSMREVVEDGKRLRSFLLSIRIVLTRRKAPAEAGNVVVTTPGGDQQLPAAMSSLEVTA